MRYKIDKIRINKKRMLILRSIAFFVLFIVLLFTVYRPWSLYWGATDEEIVMNMPGDEKLDDPYFNATRAITINAKPEEIWPWLLQIGYKRAGFYSYDRLDNDNIPSARHILQGYQDLKVGDRIPISEGGFVKVIILDQNKHMVLLFQNRGNFANATWAWGLYPTEDGQTRLLTRLRVHTQDFQNKVMLDLFEIIMMRKCMLGIKERIEHYSTDP